MPKVIYPIPGMKDSVQRPVAFDIIRQVMEWTGLPNTTNIRYPGETEKMHQPGSTISEDPEFNSFNTDPQWTITVNEEAQMDRILSTAVLYDDNPHVFWDGDSRVYIRPSYSPVDVVINFSSRFYDKETALRWRDEIRARVSTLRDVRIHTVSYSYLLPAECMVILKEINKMREAVAPYGQDFDTYFKAYVTSKASVLTDLIGNNPVWAISETQARILGWFEFEAEPEKGDKDAESTAWDIAFTYKFKYDRPMACEMEYPLVVNNQIISSKYRETKQSYRLEDNLLSYSMSSRALGYFETTRLPNRLGVPGVCLPVFDEFLPAQVTPTTLRLITLMTTIDPDHKQNLLSLTDFDDYKFTPEILTFLVNEVNYLNISDASIFSVNVYRFENLLQSNLYSINSDLMVQLAEVPSLRDQYHVRVAVHANPKMMNPLARERLRNNYTVAKQVFWALRPELQQMGIPGVALPGNIMTFKDFNKALDYIDNQYTLRKTSDTYQFNTVMSLMIESTRKN